MVFITSAFGKMIELVACHRDYGEASAVKLRLIEKSEYRSPGEAGRPYFFFS